MNSYLVTLVYPYVTVTTTVMAMHEDAAPELAQWQFREEFNIEGDLVPEDYIIELQDENVGMEKA